MNIVKFIIWGIVTIAFIAMAVFLSVWTTNYNYLWFLVIPILGYLNIDLNVWKTEDSDDTKEEQEKND